MEKWNKVCAWNFLPTTVRNIDRKILDDFKCENGFTRPNVSFYPKLTDYNIVMTFASINEFVYMAIWGLTQYFH